MSRETIQQWCEGQANRNPTPFYCTGSKRFGTTCYDCSGFTYQAYKADGKTIPADSSLVARWGRDNGQVRPVAQAMLSDLMVHDKYGDPYNSTGPRGHIGIFIRMSGDRVITYESASSKEGVGVYSRPASFWSIAVRHPVYAGVQTPDAPPPPPPPEVDDMPLLIKGDQQPHVYITDGLTKRWLESQFHVDQWKNPQPSVVKEATVAQATCDQLPLAKGSKAPADYRGEKQS